MYEIYCSENNANFIRQNLKTISKASLFLDIDNLDIFNAKTLLEKTKNIISELFHFIIIENSTKFASIIIIDFNNLFSQESLNNLACEIAPDFRVNVITFENNLEHNEDLQIEIEETIIYLAGAKNLTAQKIFIESDI